MKIKVSVQQKELLADQTAHRIGKTNKQKYVTSYTSEKVLIPEFIMNCNN